MLFYMFSFSCYIVSSWLCYTDVFCPWLKNKLNEIYVILLNYNQILKIKKGKNAGLLKFHMNILHYDVVQLG